MMLTPELFSYISTQLASHADPQDITTVLVAQGWQMTDIQAAFQKSGFTLKQVGHMTKMSGTIPSLIQATLQVVKRKWLALLGLSVLAILIFTISTFLPGPLIAYMFAYSVKTHLTWYAYVLGGLGYIVFFLIMGTIQSWGPLAMIHVILHRDERLSAWRSLSQTRKLVTRFWSLGLLSALSIVGALSFGLLPLIALLLLSSQSGTKTVSLTYLMSGPGSTLLISGIILGICFGCVLMLWTMFGAQALVDGSLKPLDAMTKSKQLVTGNVWFIILRILILFGVSALVAIIIAIGQSQVKGINVLAYAATGLLLLITSIFALIYMTLLYEYVRDQRMKPQVHPVRIKFGFAFLSILGVVMPVVITLMIIMSFGPLFSGFLTGLLTKQLKANPNLPSPLPGYVNPYTGTPSNPLSE